jgi:hypothetical protein
VGKKSAPTVTWFCNEVIALTIEVWAAASFVCPVEPQGSAMLSD